jgi:hypothetical protein
MLGILHNPQNSPSPEPVAERNVHVSFGLASSGPHRPRRSLSSIDTHQERSLLLAERGTPAPAENQPSENETQSRRWSMTI